MGANSPATQQPHHRLPLCASDPAFSSFPRSCTSCLPCLPQARGRDVCTSIPFASHLLSLPHWAPGRKASRKTPLPISGSLPSCLSWPSALPPRPAASGKCLVLTNSSRCPVVAVALSFSEDSFFSLCLLSLGATSVWILNLPTLSLVPQLYMYPEGQGLVT